MRLRGFGIAADVPEGWDARIYRRPGGDATMHAANFALPPDDGDFGSGAAGSMAADGVLVVLTEYDPALGGTGLFAPRGMPRTIRASDLDPNALQRALPGQGGVQRFFTVGGRAFCLYVVVGSIARPGPLLRQADALLDSVVIDHL